MEKLNELYPDAIKGTLNCFDRILINGNFAELCYSKAMQGTLNRQNIRFFDFTKFVDPLRHEIRDNAGKIAQENGLEIEYISNIPWHQALEKLENKEVFDVLLSITYSKERDNFVNFTHNQIMELLTEYGDVNILWLDGGWVRKYSDEEIREYYNNMNPDKPARIQNQDIRMDELVEKARKAQPGLIVVDRAV